MAVMTVMCGKRLLQNLRAGNLARLRRALKFRGQLRQRLGLLRIPAFLRGGRIGFELRTDAGGNLRILGRALLLDLVQLAEDAGLRRDAGRTRRDGRRNGGRRRRGSPWRRREGRRPPNLEYRIRDEADRRTVAGVNSHAR